MEPILADLALHACRDPERHMAYGDYEWGQKELKNPRLKMLLKRQRDILETCHKFVLDDEFVRYAGEICGNIKDDKLLACALSAMPPYEQMWIEYEPWPSFEPRAPGSWLLAHHS